MKLEQLGLEIKSLLDSNTFVVKYSSLFKEKDLKNASDYYHEIIYLEIVVVFFLGIRLIYFFKLMDNFKLIFRTLDLV